MRYGRKNTRPTRALTIDGTTATALTGGSAACTSPPRPSTAALACPAGIALEDPDVKRHVVQLLAALALAGPRRSLRLTREVKP